MKFYFWKELVLGVSIFLLSCNTAYDNTPVQLEYPNYFPKPIPSPDRNPLTKQGIELGKKLFYDKSLSGSGKVSCASCHIQSLSFSDGKKVSSNNVSNINLERNSPALINLAWINKLFWDGGVKNLESLPFAALTNPEEMDGNLNDIVVYINGDSSYQGAFKRAFNIDSISSAHIARAMAQFQRTLISTNSKYDNVQMGRASFSNDELKGQELFSSNCSSCHTPPLFTDNSFHNNGLDSDFPTKNADVRAGRFRITLDSTDLGKFKTPTLRNLKFTGPFMHDGRFSTLDAVLKYYSNGVKMSGTLDPLVLRIQLSEDDNILIRAFLNTLNDQDFLTSKEYGSQ
ncbi:MAG: cytochrome-c peroxidase [Cyclobacteriaceae bacterium]